MKIFRMNDRIFNLLAVIFLLFSSPLKAQTLHYDVILFGGDAGDASMKRTINGNKETYLLETYTEVNMVVTKRKDTYIGKLEIENGIVQKIEVEGSKNGKKNLWCYTSKYPEGYKVENEKNGLSTIAGEIKNTTYSMFYKEPTSISQVFSERWGKFFSIAKDGDHVYKMETVGKEYFKYKYSNGAMIEIEFPTPLGKGYFRKK
jgi:hypothetical protein